MVLSVKRKILSPIPAWFKTKIKINEIDEFDAIRHIMRPVIFLFLLSGINLKKTAGMCLMLISSAFFHIMCLGIIAFKMMCLFEAFQWDILVTLTMKATALILWWVLWSRRHRLCSLMDLLKNLSDHIEDKDVGRLKTLSKTVSISLVIIIFTSSGLLGLRYLHPQGYVSKCIDGASPSQYAGKIAVILLHEFSSIYVNYSITYAVAIFYALYCTTLAYCLKQKDRSESESWKTYQQTLNIFDSNKSVMSFLIFIVFAHILSSLFKDMAILIAIMKNRKVIKLYFYLLDFALNAAVMVMIVFSAEYAQNEANAVRMSLFDYSHMYHHTSLIDLNRRYIKLSEDRERLKISAWGMFLIRKPLIINITTGLVTYGVIIFQFSEDSD